MRKRLLADVIALVEAGQYERAADQASQRSLARGPAWLPAARIALELYLRLGRAGDAVGMLEAILQTGALPWARLGLARAHAEAGAVFQARRTLESLLGDHPGYADAYDVLGRVLLDDGQPGQAIEAMERATRLTPHSVGRRVKLGLLHFYYGDPREARVHLDMAARLGLNSRVFDLQGLVLQAALQFDRRDRRGLVVSMHSMSQQRSHAPHSPRLRRFEATIGVLLALYERRVPEAMAELQQLLAECMDPDFEFEAACNLLVVLSRVDRIELHLGDLADQVQRIAERFAVSRTTCEMLCGAMQGNLASTERIRLAYAGVGATAEQAVTLTLDGRPRDAALTLLSQARRSLNTKLMDLAIAHAEAPRDLDRRCPGVAAAGAGPAAALCQLWHAGAPGAHRRRALDGGGVAPRALTGYSTSLAKSARRLRSPRASITWPPCGQPLKRSTA
jgi:tetratricopeptide (TPR) repeat protein